MKGARLPFVLGLCAALALAARADDDHAKDFSPQSGSISFAKLWEIRAAPASDPAPAAAAPRDAAKLLILIGDSHTAGAFGHELDGLLRARGRTETYGSCGAAPSWYVGGNAHSGLASPCKGDDSTWFHRYSASDPSKLEEVATRSPTPTIDSLLKKKPETVVVALGTNMIDWKNGGDYDLNYAKALASAIKAAGARCLWIGPPDGLGHLSRTAATAALAKLNADLASALGGTCAYLPSQTTYQASWPDSEKLHYPPDAARTWAAQAAAHIQSALGAR